MRSHHASGDARLVLALLLSLLALPVKGQEKSSSPGIPELIRLLGSEQSSDRDRAEKLLSGLPEAAQALREAAKSPDPEVRRRAERVLQRLRQREQEHILERVKQLGEQGEIDSAAVLFAGQQWDDRVAAWSVMARIAERVCKKEKELFHKLSIERTDVLLMGDLRHHLRMRRSIRRFSTDSVLEPNPSDGGSTFLANASHLSIQPKPSDLSTLGFLVSATTVKGPSLVCCIVFAGETVEVDYIASSLIICGGDYVVREGTSTSLVIAGGNVVTRGPIGASRVIACGEVRHDPKLLTRGAAVQSNVKEPLQFIKFFEINRFGLDVESGKGIARVKSVANDGAAARAGLKVGDEIVAVGSERVEPQRSLHSLLRTAYAVGHTFQVKLRRDGRDIEVTIRPPDLKK